jgi:hypothetical protein
LEIDLTNGITTIDAKLDKMCPYFAKLDGLYGHHQNVTPAAIDESSALDEEVYR